MNEISLPMAFLTFPATALFQLSKEVKIITLRAGANLMRNIGSFTIDKQAEYWAKQRAALQKALEQEKAATENEGDGAH